MIKEEKKGLVFIEDEIDLQILHLARKLHLLNQDDFNNLLIVCCDYHFLNKAQTISHNVKYIFDLVEVDSIQYQAYLEAKQATLHYFEKIEKRYTHLHYSLLPYLQGIFYSILISDALAKLIIKDIQPNYLILLPYKKLPFITFYKGLGCTVKNGIFGAILGKSSQDKNGPFPQIKKIPWVLGVFINPKAIFQFLPSQAIFEWPFLIWQKLFQKRQSSNKITPSYLQPVSQKEKKEAVFINWGGDLTKHTSLTELSAKMSSTEPKVIHLLWRKEKIPTLPANQHIFYKQSLKSYLIKRGFLSLGLEILKTLNECISILKKDEFFQKKFYSRNLFFAYCYLYFYGTLVVEAYRKWLLSVFSKFSPKILVTSDLSNCIGRTFVFSAREWGAKVFTFSHGCSLHIPWLDPSDELGDKILVSGLGVVSNIQKAGITQDRFVIVGERKRQLLSAIYPQKDRQKTIAFITSMKLGNWLEPRHFSLFFKNIETMAAEFLKAGFRVIIKSHKIADYWEFYDGLVQRYKNYPIEHTKKRWRAADLAACDAAIFPGGISSMILDYQAVAVPLIYLDILSKTEREVLGYDYENCGAVVRTAEEAVESVKRLFTNQPYFEEVIGLGRRFYKNHVNIEKDFSEELTKLIHI